MLNSQDLRRFQERLKAEHDTIESRIATNKRGIQETVRNESGVGDFEDEASLISEREAEIDENDRDQKELAQVKRALERIEHGTYGLSEVSGAGGESFRPGTQVANDLRRRTKRE